MMGLEPNQHFEGETSSDHHRFQALPGLGSLGASVVGSALAAVGAPTDLGAVRGTDLEDIIDPLVDILQFSLCCRV